MKLKEIINITGLPVFIASLCCLAPIVLVLVGISTVSFAASLTNLLEGQYQWVFILVGLMALAVSVIYYLRNRGICTLDQAVRHRNEIINKVLIVLTTSIVGYYLFFYVLLDYIGRTLQIWK